MFAIKEYTIELFVSSMSPDLASGIGRETVVNSPAIHLITRHKGLSERLLAVQAKVQGG
ncbi:hypothetical protein LC653_23065 [Nostoc sp. CHAB 5784]|uniref:hypothetical protein n=1 Tax=Nostoc mirabile TaxID=2907820 RepID=UPI001E2F1ECD|nr:hypothetical protein [Nostoc mirabile]MCC5666689.1 hypothetical protein [Nostoc mirabile CHAB5784]